MRAFQIIVAVGLTVLTASPAFAYRYRICSALGSSANLKLPSNNWTVRSSDVSFPAGYWQDGLNNAISQYNKNPSNFYYTRVSDTNGLGLGNGESEVWGSTDNSILQGAPAIAYSYWDCYWLFGLVANMKEGDVIFDYRSPFQWTATTSKTALFSYSGTGRLLQGTAIHEFGHAAGLLHENRTYNVMGTDFTHLATNGSVSNGYIGEDTGNGDVFLYGLWTSGPQDLGVAHWRYLGVNGEYSTHARTRIFNPSTGAELSFSTIAGEPRYNVIRGGSVSAEFTFENMGRDTQTNVPVNFYISGNDTITTGDRLIGSMTVTLSRDWVSTFRRTLRIPANLVAGRGYWLGAIINPSATVPESDRSNNATYIGILTN